MSLTALTAIGERAALRAMRLAPKQLYSTVVDWGSRRRVPRALRQPLYAGYSLLVGANLGEVELPLSDYNSFGEFFARRLKAGARDPSTDLTAVASPCDGRIGTFGEVEDGSLLQAKGRSYKLSELVGDPDFADRLMGQVGQSGPSEPTSNATQVTIYLSPADYHRVHAPLSGKLLGYTYIPGARYPVGGFFTKHVDRLFATNERLVIELETSSGPVAIVLVGALGVGNLCLSTPAVESRELSGQRVVRHVRFDEPIPVARGEELGAFHLGSTVVLVFPAGVFACDGLASDQRVECGQAMGRLGSSPAWMVQ